MGQLAQLGERVGLLLFGFEEFGEVGDESTGKRDVAGLNLDVGCLSKGADDWQKRIGREGRCLVSLGVDNCGLLL